MNNTINRLLINDKCIVLEGFDQINDFATFCFYPSGIVIMSELPERVKEYHVLVKLDSDKKIRNENILRKLLQRGLSNETIFIKHLANYYELNPHEEK